MPVGGNDSELTSGPIDFTSVLIVHREPRRYKAFVTMGPVARVKALYSPFMEYIFV